MTYFLSKALWALFKPLTAITLLLVLGLLAQKLARKSSLLRRTGGVFIGLSALLIFMLGFTNVPDRMLYVLENQAATSKLPENPAGIIILGGGLNPRVTRSRQVDYALDGSGDRLIRGFELARKFPGIPLVYSGGPARQSETRDMETEVARRLAIALYGNDLNMISESRSRNTWENAVFTKTLVNPKPGDVWIVVTSAYHGVRTRGIFQKIGFEINLQPTDYRAEFDIPFELSVDPVGQLKKAELTLKELAGIIAYTLLGRMDWPFGK